MTRSRIQAGGSWASTGVGAVRVEDGLDGDPGVADPVADLGGGGGAELLGPADAHGRVEVGVVEVQVELGLRVPARFRSAVTLRTPRGAGSPCGLEVGGGGADPVVEVGEGHRVADDVELAGAGVLGGVGVVQHHVPGRLRPFLAGGVLLGHVLGDGLGDGAVEEGDPHGVQPGGEHPVDVGGGLHGQGVGLLGDPAGPPDRHVQRLGAAPGVREPVDQVEGVGHQRHRGAGGDAEGEAEGFGRERGHRGVPSPPRDSSASRCGVAAPDRGAGVGGGGVQDTPLVGELELVELGLAAAYLGVLEGTSSASGPRSSTPDRLVAAAAHGSSQAAATDTRTGSEPLVHKGIEEIFGVP